VDARAPEFYNGEKPGIEGAVPGHIPGAHNIPFTTVSDADGKLKWVTPLTQYMDEKHRKPILWAGPVLAGDRLLITGTTGEMLALSPYDGQVMGKINLNAPVRLAPVIANRTIYVLTDTGRLIALR